MPVHDIGRTGIIELVSYFIIIISYHKYQGQEDNVLNIKNNVLIFLKEAIRIISIKDNLPINLKYKRPDSTNIRNICQC